MSQIELEQELQREGMWVSGINKKLNSKEIIDSSPTKTALFYALYQGPVKNQSINKLIQSTK